MWTGFVQVRLPLSDSGAPLPRAEQTRQPIISRGSTFTIRATRAFCRGGREVPTCTESTRCPKTRWRFAERTQHNLGSTNFLERLQNMLERPKHRKGPENISHVGHTCCLHVWVKFFLCSRCFLLTRSAPIALCFCAFVQHRHWGSHVGEYGSTATISRMVEGVTGEASVTEKHHDLLVHRNASRRSRVSPLLNREVRTRFVVCTRT